MSDTQVGKQCLVHYNVQHLQVRKDFLDLCAYDKNDYNKDTRKSGKIIRDEPNQECMAKILRLLETLTDSRKSYWQHNNEDLIARKKLPLKEPAEYRIELAYSTIVRLLYNTCGESTIRNSMTVLIQRGYVMRYQKNNASIPLYVLNISLLQALLQNQTSDKVLSEEEVLNVTPSDPDNFLGDDKVLNTTPKGVNATPKPVHSTPKPLNVTPSNIVDKISCNIASKSSSTTHNNHAISSSENDEENTPSQQEMRQSNPVTPTGKETRGETQDACLNQQKIYFSDKEEQTLWEVLFAAHQYQKARLYRDVKPWETPTKKQREQISAMLQELRESHRTVSSLTSEMIEQAWIDKMEASPYLKKDPEWKMGNIGSAIMEYLKQYTPVETTDVVVEEQGSDQLVLWTKKPGKIGSDIATFWTILEWMPEREAKKYYYNADGAFSAEEIEQYEQLTRQRELAIAV